MRFSEQQKKAIDSRNKNVVVSASAGAGKTTVLVERLTRRIIDDKVDVDRILATTFTEAAAGDIKKKLTRSLRNSYEETREERLKRQIALLADADISTLHSFCLKIIKKYYYVIGLDVSITENIFDETTTNYFKNVALTRVFDAAYKENTESFLELLDRQSSSITSKTMLEESIKRLASAALTHYDYEAWLDQAASVYRVYGSLKELPEEMQNLFFQYLWHYSYMYEEKLEEARAAFTEEGQQDSLLVLEVKIRHLKNEVFAALENRDYSLFRSLMQQNADLKVKRPNKMRGSAILKDAYAIYSKLLEDLYEERILLQDLKENEKAARELVHLTKAFLTEYRRLKAEAQGIEFDDMERYALDILKADNGSIAAALRNHYIDILVDEFQDTNYAQDEIIRLIARENNVFRVGDVKQSIYRFRNAKPAIMQKLINEPQEMDEILYLNQNYRSSGALITFNNDLFTRLMNLEHRPVYFPGNDIVSPGTEQQKSVTIPAEFLLLDADQYKESSLTVNERKAARIAEEILRLKEENPSMQYKDIAVLVNANRNKITIQNMLAVYGIPSFGGESLGLYESSGVKAILSFLEYSVDPSNEIALYSVLTSFFHYSDEDLLQVRKNGLETYDPLNAQLIQEIAFASVSLGEKVSAILRLNDYYEQWNDDNQRANIDLFLDVVDDHDKKGDTVESFLYFISNAVDETAEEASLSNDDADAVKIMSIHHSKGLEFPVVFLFSKDRTLASHSDSYTFLHSDYGFSIPSLEYPWKYKRENVISLALKHQDKMEEIEESVRVLYVALTRAKTRLYIVDERDPAKEIPAFSYSALFQNSYTTWMLELRDYCHYQTVNRTQLEGNDKAQALTAAKRSFTYPRYNVPLAVKETLSPSSTEEDRTDLTLRFRKNTAAEIGTRVHEAFELLPPSLWSEEEIQAILKDGLQSYTEAFRTFRDSPLYAEMLKGDIYKELPFLTRLNDSTIHGYIDMCSVLKDKVIIIDFKTDRNVTPEILIERYTSQIDLYKRSMKQIYPDREILGYIYSVTLNDFIQL